MLPLLTPMSEVAGRMSIQIGSNYLAKHNGGRGVLLDGTSTVKPGKVVVIGCGIAGTNALIAATGRGCKVVAFDVKDEALARVKKQFGDKVDVMKSNPDDIKSQIKDADILVGAVLVPGAKAPKVITEEMIKSMQPGSVFVDIAIDQGGCSETSKGTTHSDPVFVKHGVIHYCVTNMPGAYPRTSTLALADATMPYIIKIADMGVEGFASADAGFACGVNTYKGFLTNKDVAAAWKKEDKLRELSALL
jgi:alanine dehydrogenase